MTADDPDRKPQDSEMRPRRAPQSVWDVLNTGHPVASSLSGFAYLDRVGPEMFVGRYDHGTCGTIRADDANHAEWVDTPALDVRAVKARNHAYVITVTPDGSQSVCIYCGTVMEGCPVANPSDIRWDGHWDRPRRATRREMDAVGAQPIPERVMLYLDGVDGRAWTGRFRVGECPEGGTHEAVLYFWDCKKDALHSFCVFCGERWTGSPPGFWDVVQPHIRADEELARHAGDVRRGLY